MYLETKPESLHSLYKSMNTTLAVVLKAPRMFARTSSEYRDFLAAELFCYAMIYLKNLQQAKNICFNFLQVTQRANTYEQIIAVASEIIAELKNKKQISTQERINDYVNFCHEIIDFYIAFFRNNFSVSSNNFSSPCGLLLFFEAILYFIESIYPNSNVCPQNYLLNYIIRPNNFYYMYIDELTTCQQEKYRITQDIGNSLLKRIIQHYKWIQNKNINKYISGEHVVHGSVSTKRFFVQFNTDSTFVIFNKLRREVAKSRYIFESEKYILTDMPYFRLNRSLKHAAHNSPVLLNENVMFLLSDDTLKLVKNDYLSTGV